MTMKNKGSAERVYCFDEERSQVTVNLISIIFWGVLFRHDRKREIRGQIRVSITRVPVWREPLMEPLEPLRKIRSASLVIGLSQISTFHDNLNPNTLFSSACTLGNATAVNHARHLSTAEAVGLERYDTLMSPLDPTPQTRGSRIVLEASHCPIQRSLLTSHRFPRSEPCLPRSPSSHPRKNAADDKDPSPFRYDFTELRRSEVLSAQWETLPGCVRNRGDGRQKIGRVRSVSVRYPETRELGGVVGPNADL